MSRVFWVLILAAAVAAVAITSCSVQKDSEGFAITLAESGEVVLSDEHIAAYDVARHAIVLNASGIERWRSFTTFDHSFDPPIPKLSGLFGKEFVLTVGGKEMYRGFFWSMASSSLKTGVLIYDTLPPVNGELTVAFQRLGDDAVADPRNNETIVAYFQRQGKLR
jgi:hypothetical protein